MLATSAVRAHFLWLVPDKGAATAQVLFSDSLTPDSLELLAKVAKTQWYARDNAARSSNARFWVVLALLVFLTVVFALTAWHQVQTTFGI